MASHFFVPPQHASQYTLPEKTDQIHCFLYDSNVPSLNSVIILTVCSVENFKNFRTYQYLVYLPTCQPACLPAVRPTSTKSMVPDFSHNKSNCVRFTKLLLRLGFIHCAMASLFILHCLSCSFFIH